MTHIIYNIRKTLSALAVLTALMILAASCEHKDLYMRQAQKQLVKIHFDWDNLLVSDDKPETMTLFFYNDRDGSVTRYDVPTAEDDFIIEVYSGLYDIVSYSTDDPSIASRFTDDKDVHDILAMELNNEVPTVYGYNCDVEIDYHDEEAEPDYEMQVVNIAPEAIYSKYYVRVENADVVEGATMWQASLSGLSNSIYAEDHDCSDNASESVIAFPLNEFDETCYFGQINTFGKLDNSEHWNTVNKLLITILKDDKTVVYYLFDVTDQIDNAYNPRNVHITVDLATATALQPGDPDYPDDNKPTEENGGMNAGVDDFENEDIEVNV